MVADRDGEEAEAVTAALATPGLTHVADLTVPGTETDLVAATLKAFGQIDIVVNNAGYGGTAAPQVTDEQFRAMLDIHTVVPFRVLRAAASRMREAAKADKAAGREEDQRQPRRVRRHRDAAHRGPARVGDPADRTADPAGPAGQAAGGCDGILFLCSPAANYVHGQVLNVSGGLAIGMAG